MIVRYSPKSLSFSHGFIYSQDRVEPFQNQKLKLFEDIGTSRPWLNGVDGRLAWRCCTLFGPGPAASEIFLGVVDVFFVLPDTFDGLNSAN
jgi:hypothetical protein